MLSKASIMLASLIHISVLHSVQVMVTSYGMLRKNLEPLLEVWLPNDVCAQAIMACEKLTRHRIFHVFSSQSTSAESNHMVQVPWHVCILDEVHMVKNRNADVTQAAMQLRTCFR